MGSQGREYSNAEKWQVLQDAKKLNDVKKACEKWGVSRGSFYNWRKQEDEIRRAMQEEEIFSDVREKSLVRTDVLKNIKDYPSLLAEVGSMEERRKRLGAMLENMAFTVAKMIEDNPDLAEVHPKDQATILKTVHEIKEKLYREPDIVVEYRNEMMETVLKVLQDFLEDSEIREFVKKVEAVEADYEILE